MQLKAMSGDIENWFGRKAIENFATESNRIEGIDITTSEEVNALLCFLNKEQILINDLEEYVSIIQKGAKLRCLEGMNVRVGNHIPPLGGKDIIKSLDDILLVANIVEKFDSFIVHKLYESLHPFMDGNGRSGRALWLWQIINSDPDYAKQCLNIGFLHSWYYQSLRVST